MQIPAGGFPAAWQAPAAPRVAPSGDLLCCWSNPWQRREGRLQSIASEAATHALHGVEQGMRLTLVEQARTAVSCTHLTTYSGSWEGGKNVCQWSKTYHPNEYHLFPDF